jgi:hypothetical protein
MRVVQAAENALSRQHHVTAINVLCGGDFRNLRTSRRGENGSSIFSKGKCGEPPEALLVDDDVRRWAQEKGLKAS